MEKRKKIMLTATAAEIRELESRVFAAGIAPYALMRRAGEAAARFIAHHAAGSSRIVVLTGSGNNAGDALVAAAELSRRFHVEVRAVKPLQKLSGPAAEAFRDLPAGIPVEVRETLAADEFRAGDFIVDGLLGIGFRGALRPQYAQFIRSVNASGLPVAALDLPSGLDADTGEAVGEAIRATLTITFGFPKPGLFRNEGPRHRGMLRIVPLGLPLPCTSSAFPAAVYTMDDAVRDLPVPDWDTHKFRRGALLIAAGSRRYSGAAALAAAAGLRAGAGVVKLLIPEGTRLPGIPAALIVEEAPATVTGCFADDAAALLPAAAGSYGALAAGPGWGEADPGVLRAALDCPAPLILDADALNLVARSPESWRRREVPTVITPHPGEAARLAAAFGIAPEKDRMKFAAALARKLHAVTVLKGAQSVIAPPEGMPYLNTSGSPDLATAGSGDVLTGVIGALLAAGCEAERAARLGVWIHGAAGEIGGAGTIADDLPAAVARIIRLLRRRGEIY